MTRDADTEPRQQLPGNGPGVPIVITCPSSGSGGIINSVNAHGFASTPSVNPAI